MPASTSTLVSPAVINTALPVEPLPKTVSLINFLATSHLSRSDNQTGPVNFESVQIAQGTQGQRLQLKSFKRNPGDFIYLYSFEALNHFVRRNPSSVDYFLTRKRAGTRTGGLQTKQDRRG